MKNDKGVTLIELLIVIAVFGALAVALGFSFLEWKSGYNIESQTKVMYDDLMEARIEAMQRNRNHFVVVSTDDYSIFEDTNDNGAYNAGTDGDMVRFINPKFLTYPVESSSFTGQLTMDKRGIVSPNKTIQFDIGDSSPDYDCIVLFATRINMGKWNGSTCDAK